MLPSRRGIRYTHPTNARKLDALESFAVDGPNLC
jgi:hypothetical protein